MKDSKNKVLIFILAYNAESHIENVLRRIPDRAYSKYEYEILVIDDSSGDKTFEKVKQYQKSNDSLNLRVLYNPVNQGYGGNQKLGYTYAVRHDFDAVVMVHGDGQYAPELMEHLIDPILDNKADAVFGSRMLEKKDALKGGMPYYKYLGNIILTKIQNYILKSNLSEFHSGYRAYSIEALRRIPFEKNSNVFDFDTQIIIQLFKAKLRVLEVPIPTHYGNEVCHVNGYKYAWDILRESLESRLHSMNIFYKREYDIEDDLPIYDLKLGYNSSHSMAINAVKNGSRVLDIGSGRGLIAKELKRKNCSITGIDIDDEFESSVFDNFYKANIDSMSWNMDLEDFDYVLMLDIIEHAVDPELLMDRLRKNFGTNTPRIIVTTPNIAFIAIRLSLLLGNFNYGKKGILDMTHKRLYTFSSFKRMCAQTGYRVKVLKGVSAPFPKALGNNFFSKLLVGINSFLNSFWKKLFAYQIYAELEPTPDVDNMLQYTIRESKKKAEIENY